MKMQGKIAAHQRPSWGRNWEKLMHSTFKHFARALPVVAMVATNACSGGTPRAPDSANATAAHTTGAGPDGSNMNATAPTLMPLYGACARAAISRARARSWAGLGCATPTAGR